MLWYHIIHLTPLTFVVPSSGLPDAAIWWCLRTGGGGVRSRRDLFHFAKTTEFSLSVWLQEQIPNTDTLNSTPTLSRRCRHSAFGIRHSALGNSAVFSFPRSKNNSSPHVSIWNTISRDRNVRIAPNVSPFLTGGGGEGGEQRKEGGQRFWDFWSVS
jgi:hypothetical protein